MQHTQETGQISADIFFNGRQFFHGFGRGPEEGGIADALMAADKRPNKYGDVVEN